MQNESAPEEFTPEFIAQHSPESAQLYRDFLRCGEPWLSLFANNPHLQPPRYNEPLSDDPNCYWNTTVARKHPYWQNFELPQPTQHIQTMRADLERWGYCLIKDALSAEQNTVFHQRLTEQAAGERSAGLRYDTPSGQYVNTLINKGHPFAACIEQDPKAIQAGPVIEQIMNETLGKGWICHSFLANGADPGGYPQGLHIDQGPLLPHMTTHAPALMNTMFIPQDVDEHNGGTLLIPGSHKQMIEAGNGGQIGALPPTINLEAKAGTVMLFDGRLLHGTGVNRSSQQRFVATMSNVTPWTRTQENWALSVAPDVLAQASDKLLHRIGLQALTYGATIEGFGLGGNGRVAEPWGYIKPFREAYDRGDYLRVRELSPESEPAAFNAPYTVKAVMQKTRSH